jgi:hypothetical protein
VAASWAGLAPRHSTQSASRRLGDLGVQIAKQLDHHLRDIGPSSGTTAGCRPHPGLRIAQQRQGTGRWQARPQACRHFYRHDQPWSLHHLLSDHPPDRSRRRDAADQRQPFQRRDLLGNGLP